MLFESFDSIYNMGVASVLVLVVGQLENRDVGVSCRHVNTMINAFFNNLRPRRKLSFVHDGIPR